MSKKATIRILGVVRGVGFRPHIYKTANMPGIAGYAKNPGDAGVDIRGVIEGVGEAMVDFGKFNPL